MRMLVSIDDTDNLESRGTGYQARRLGGLLSDELLVRVRGISRHQLFVHPDIPYTSHNSALCLDLDWCGSPRPLSYLARITREYLAAQSAPGSDAGFCIASFDEVSPELVAFGQRAKVAVLAQAEARDLARRTGVVLEGVTGDQGGVIGALASVGLRKSGNDGRFVWVKGVRELSGVTTVANLLATTGIDLIQPSTNDLVDGAERILVEPWPRPVLLDDKAVLLVERGRHDDCEWRLVPREVVKQY